MIDGQIHDISDRIVMPVATAGELSVDKTAICELVVLVWELQQLYMKKFYSEKPYT